MNNKISAMKNGIVPKKNIKKILEDVLPPAGVILKAPPKNAPSTHFGLVTEKKISIETPPLPKRRFKKFSIAFLGIVLVSSFIYGTHFYLFKEKAVTSLKKINEHISGSASSLLALDPEGASRRLAEARSLFEDIEKEGGKLGIFELGKALGSFWQPIEDGISALPGFENMLSSSLRVSEHLAFFKGEGLTLFLKGEGDPVLKRLEALSIDLKTLDATSEKLLSASRSLGSLVGSADAEGYLSLKVKIYEAREFVDSLLAVLKRKGDVYVALLFENPSEMRPSGGFIGSYAIFTIQNGGLKHIEVRDIYDPDGQLKLKTVPPKPLQAITTNWGARDANWFLDFPLSAQKVLRFLESSEIYKERGVIFDAAVALNANVVASLLGVSGPISLPEYDLELTEENFLDKIQTEVRSGKGRTKGEPKQILKDVAPILFEKLSVLNGEKIRDVVNAIGAHAVKKDIRAYFRNTTLQNFVLKAGFAGDVFRIPQKFSGDYLAVVNANIAGGKTDIVVDQAIVLRSRITTDGKIENELAITRAHNGDKERYSWYKETNQNYLRVYAPKGSALVSVSGDSAKNVYPPINYKKAGYEVDVDVAQAEEQGEEFGKAVFGAWLNVPVGAKKTIIFRYEGSDYLDLRDGQVYRFVFERQPGVRGGIEYELEAPPGFKWEESNSPLFRYVNQDPEGRLILEVTLRKV